jgi:four helix bundle protein
MSFKKFEDLPIWQEGRILSRKVYEATSKPKFRDFSLRDQMRRCIISFLSNVAEGFERGSNKEFIQFLYIAKGSLGELRCQVYLAYDNNFINNEEFLILIKDCLDLSAKISNFIRYLRNSKITKLRHKTNS